MSEPSSDLERAREHQRYLMGRLRGEVHRRENAEEARDTAFAVIERALDLVNQINTYEVEISGPNGGLSRLRRMLTEHSEAKRD